MTTDVKADSRTDCKKTHDTRGLQKLDMKFEIDLIFKVILHPNDMDMGSSSKLYLLRVSPLYNL